MSTFPKITTLISLALLLGSTMPAAAQYRLGRGYYQRPWGQQGYALGTASALDNNLRYGSGGYNRGSLFDTYGTTIGNSIVTSNVTGLAGFRGRINYTAPGEFHGRLGSNDIYDFQRRSYLPSAASPLTGPANPSAYSVPAYSGNASYGTTALVRRAGSGASSGLVTGQQTSPAFQFDSSAYRYTASVPNFSRLARLREQTLTTTVNPQGLPVSIKTSPLMGLTYQPLYKQPAYSYQPPTPPAFTGISPAENPTQPGQTGEPTGTSAASATAVASALAVQPDLSAYNKGLLATRTQPVLLAPGGLLGQQIKTGLLAGAQTQEQADQAQAIHQSLFRLLAARPTPGEDAYLDMLRRIEQSDQSTDQSSSTPGQTAPGPKRITMEQLLEKLQYKMPSIDSFVGIGDKPVDRTLARAEQHMKTGRYFDAEQAYDAVLRMQPDYPLARIGQVHAQIGAGLYRSAGRQLHALFVDHPEMIRARYGKSLLPDAQRLARVEMQLNQQLEKQADVPELALILAYLGYQKNNDQQVRRALERVEQALPDDPLTALLQRLWLDKKQQPVGKQAP